MIDWVNGSTGLYNLILKPVYDQVKLIQSNFTFILFAHICRENDIVADGWLKRALELLLLH